MGFLLILGKELRAATAICIELVLYVHPSDCRLILGLKNP